MKRLPPSIQEKYRYIRFKAEGDEKSIGQVVDAIWNSTLKHMGADGVSDAELRIIGNKFDEEKQRGIIKVKKGKVNDLRAALTLNNGFSDDTFLVTEKVSGTLKSLEED